MHELFIHFGKLFVLLSNGFDVFLLEICDVNLALIIETLVHFGLGKLAFLSAQFKLELALGVTKLGQFL